MERRSEGSIWQNMKEMRLNCQREIELRIQQLKSISDSFPNSLQSVKLKAEETAGNQVKLHKLMSQLTLLEDDLVKTLAVKNHMEVKCKIINDSILAAKARREECTENFQDQRAKKAEYAGIVSQQSLALATFEEKVNKEIGNKDIEEAISLYKRALGFRIEGGHGVKFIFSKINFKNPNEEYSFTFRHANDVYTLLDCNPYDGIKELIKELNQTDDLFKFLTFMREKFHAAASIGILPQVTSLADSSIISRSSPASSISIDIGSDSPEKENDLQNQSGETCRFTIKFNHGRVGKSKVHSPASTSSICRSTRLMVKQ